MTLQEQQGSVPGHPSNNGDDDHHHESLFGKLTSRQLLDMWRTMRIDIADQNKPINVANAGLCAHNLRRDLLAAPIETLDDLLAKAELQRHLTTEPFERELASQIVDALTEQVRLTEVPLATDIDDQKTALGDLDTC